jgi:hypothetical protein
MNSITYTDIYNASIQAVQSQEQRELEILSLLESIDPDLVKDGLDLLDGARDNLARYLIGKIPALGGATCYSLLAAGKRDRVIQLFNAVRYGIYL